MILIETSTTPIIIDPKQIVRVFCFDKKVEITTRDNNHSLMLRPPDGVSMATYIRNIHEQLNTHGGYNQALDDVCTELAKVSITGDREEATIFNEMVASMISEIKGMKK